MPPVNKKLISKTRFNTISIIVILVWTSGIYWNTFNNAFQFDDELVIVNNQESIKNIFNINYILSESRPLLYFSLAINYYFGELNVVGYHIVNLLIHLAVSVLVFFLAKRISYYFENKNIETVYQSYTKFLPLFTALLFAVHPINTQTVNYISARSSSLCVFFYLLSLLLFIQYKEIDCDNQYNQKYIRRRLYYTGSITAFILALAAREMAVILPLIIIFYDFIFYDTEEITHKNSKNSIIKRYRLYHLPFWIIIVAGLIKNGLPSIVVPISTNLIMACKSYIYYLKLLLFPVGLSIDHYFPVTASYKTASSLIALLLVFTLITTNVIFFKKMKIVSFSIFLYFIALLPTSSVLLVNPGSVVTMIGEHRIYASSIAFSILLPLLIIYLSTYSEIFFSIKSNKMRAGSSSKMIQLIILVPILITFSVITVNRNYKWKNEVTLWSSAVKHYPQKFKAQYNLGFAYTRKEMWEESILPYTEALKLNNMDAETHNNLGISYNKTGEIDKAIIEFEKAVELNSNYYDAYFNLANVYQEKGFLDRSIIAYQKSIELKPDNAIAVYNLGSIFLITKELDKAAVMFNKVLHILKTSVFDNLEIFSQHYSYMNEKITENREVLESRSINNIGNIFMQKGDIDKAIFSYKKALESDDNNAGTHNNLGLAFYEKGLIEKAEKEIKTALLLNSELPIAHNLSGIIYNGRRDYENALESFKRAVECNPNYASAHKNLGLIYLNYKKDKTKALFHLNETLRLTPDQKHSEDIKSLVESLE